MNIKATILVDGEPLRQAYVEHIVLGVGGEMYLTDVEGNIRDKDFNKGIESFTPNADIRIICQNPIVRVLDGGALNIGVHQDKSGITNGDTINLNTLAEQRLHYRILNLVHVTYEVAFKPLSFFQSLPNPDFPLGRMPSLRNTRDQAKRIDLSFPDGFQSPSSFVEPTRLGDDFPLIHIKPQTNAFDAGRLFGQNGAAPTLIPSELPHALHFAFLSNAKRHEAENKYVHFITSSVVAGGTGTHGFPVPTTPEVAYIEALDHFSVRFTEFMRLRQGGAFLVAETPTPALHAEFVRQQWRSLTTSIVPLLPNFGLFPFRGGGGGGAVGLIGTHFLSLARQLLRPECHRRRRGGRRLRRDIRGLRPLRWARFCRQLLF